MAFVPKSITALLIGIAIDKRYIKDDEQPVVRYFTEYITKNDSLFKLRVKDLLNMSSGFRCSWITDEQELEQMNNSRDWVKFMFDLPFVTLPGDSFSYCSGNYYLLAEILQRTTGMTCHDFAEENPVTNGRLFNLPVALKGSWDNNTLIIHYNELCGLNLLKLSFLSVIHPLI